MVYKETTDSGELYVYINGILVYKRWSDGNSIIFEKYGIPTWKADRNKGNYR